MTDSSASVPAGTSDGLARLVASVSGAGARGPAPVELWDPPYCGEIGLSITHDGIWMYRGSPIGRQPLVRLFAGVLRKDADGRHYLVTPVEKIGIDVADAPFLAVEMVVDATGGQRTVSFRTNVDDVVTVDEDHPLRFETEPHSGGLKPYVRVRGRLEALVTRALYYDLVELAEVENDSLGVRSAGVFFPMAPAASMDAG